MAVDESKFDALAAATLEKMADGLADLEDDRLDVSLESGVMTLSFEDGARYVINSHRAAKQIWMAANATAWHFDHGGEGWIASKSGDELWATVERCTSEKLGRSISLPR